MDQEPQLKKTQNLTNQEVEPMKNKVFHGQKQRQRIHLWLATQGIDDLTLLFLNKQTIKLSM